MIPPTFFLVHCCNTTKASIASFSLLACFISRIVDVKTRPHCRGQNLPAIRGDSTAYEMPTPIRSTLTGGQILPFAKGSGGLLVREPAVDVRRHSPFEFPPAFRANADDGQNVGRSLGKARIESHRSIQRRRERYDLQVQRRPRVGKRPDLFRWHRIDRNGLFGRGTVVNQTAAVGSVVYVRVQSMGDKTKPTFLDRLVSSLMLSTVSARNEIQTSGHASRLVGQSYPAIYVEAH